MVQVPPTCTLPLLLQPLATGKTPARKPRLIMKPWRVVLARGIFIAVLFQQEARQPIRGVVHPRRTIMNQFFPLSALTS
jgi:hypothetical protein